MINTATKTEPVNERDRLDRYWAAAISAALHLAVAAWILSNAPATQPVGMPHPLSNATSPDDAGESEFRLPLTVISLTKPTSAAEPKMEAAADQILPDTPEVAAQAAQEAEMQSQPAAPMATGTAEAAAPTEPVASLTEMPSEHHHPAPQEQAYLIALRAAVQSKWPRQSGACSVTIQQAIGGQVISAISRQCSLDESGRRELEEAVFAAQPLPYAGFERVFQEQITLQMEE